LKQNKNIIPEKDSIVLDTHIVISNRRIWLHKKGIEFETSMKIRPEAYYIVRYLYDIRNNGNSFTANELYSKLNISSVKIFQTRVSELNKMCRDTNLKELIVPYTNKTWILNPKLDCFLTSP